jgi:hypothetical protein
VASGPSSELAGSDVVRRAYFGDLPGAHDLPQDMTEALAEVAP